MEYYGDIPGWCAGGKISLSEYDFDDGEYPSQAHLHQSMLQEAANEGRSVAVVSVNRDEVKCIAFLKKFKWKPGPLMKNWNHGGRTTRLWFFQISKTIYKEFN